MDILNHLIDSMSAVATISDNFGHQQLHTEHNILGGMDVYDAQHHLLNRTEPNILGGMNHFDAHHHMQGYTTHNIYGGTDMHDASGHVNTYSQPNIFGGADFHNNLGHTVASTQHPNGLNSEQWRMNDSSFHAQLANEFQSKFLP